MRCIYILTNKSFPDWIKIGYASDVDKRLCELNRSECTPFAFHLYATYEVESKLSDKNIHRIIDRLNHTLRSREKLENGKERVREFFNMSPEDAYQILSDIAALNDCSHKLKRYSENTNIVPYCKKSNSEKKCEDGRPTFSFSECGIFPGDEISFREDLSIKCTVVDDRKVLYQGVTYYLSALACKLLGNKPYHNVSGPKWFMYNGKRLNDLWARVKNSNGAEFPLDTNKRRPSFSFEQFGIKAGELLTFTKDPSVTCVVIDGRKVKYQDQIYSISGLARKLLGKTRSVNGLLYFSHNGKVLLDLWKDTLC